ncbi:MAG TPA: hypothetical protein VEP91_11895 [Solirubrobacterales bacterium]|nr:hypothetical protein [Solirubrobacterales bacterium]
MLLVAWAVALPATASAGGWDIDPQSGKFPLQFTVAAGVTSWTTESTLFECTSLTGSGRYETATTGSIELTLHGCASISPSLTCTSSGQPKGTITTNEMQFHNIFLEPEKGKPGFLITAKEGRFASFACNGIAMELSGNGLIAEMTAPKCGEAGKTLTQLYEASSLGHQKWMQAETAGTKYDLSWTLGGTAAFQTTSTLTLAEQATVTC